MPLKEIEDAEKTWSSYAGKEINAAKRDETRLKMIRHLNAIEEKTRKELDSRGVDWGTNANVARLRRHINSTRKNILVNKLEEKNVAEDLRTIRMALESALMRGYRR